MFRSTRNAWLAGLVISLLAGYFLAGHYLYKAPIGLDSTAFVAGDAIQDAVLSFKPDIKNAVGGAVWLGVWALLLVLVVPIFFFVKVRGSVRARVDPERRSFLTGAGSGALVGCHFRSWRPPARRPGRGLLGLGTGHGGWSGHPTHQRSLRGLHPSRPQARVGGEPHPGEAALRAHGLGGLRHRARNRAASRARTASASPARPSTAV